MSGEKQACLTVCLTMRKVLQPLFFAILSAVLAACSNADGIGLHDTQDLGRLVRLTGEVSAGDVTVILQAGEELTATGPVVAPEGKNLIIRGIPGAPAHIVLGEGGFVASGSIVIENAVIDAATIGTPLIALSAQPSAEALNGTDYYDIPTVTLRNVTVRGLRHELLSDSGEKYCVQRLTVDNSHIGLAADGTARNGDGNMQNAGNTPLPALFNLSSGGAKELLLTATTVDGNGAQMTDVVAYHPAARLDRYGFDTATDRQSIVVEGCLFTAFSVAGKWINAKSMTANSFTNITMSGNSWVQCKRPAIARH